ncbi:hypothetical protein ACKFKG_32940 [Phormidesmis sp. 146-35]
MTKILRGRARFEREVWQGILRRNRSPRLILKAGLKSSIARSSKSINLAFVWALDDLGYYI